MNLHLAVVAGLIATFAAAWAVQSGAEPLHVRVLAKGALSGIHEPTQEVIKDKAAFEKLWAKHNTRHLGETPVPEVDFSKEIVVFVAMGRKNTGGYNIHIIKVEPVGGKLRISVQRKTPPPGGIAVQVITAPFEFVAVPKSDLPPEFVDEPPPPPATKP
jgi:hypothetical protein